MTENPDATEEFVIECPEETPDFEDLTPEIDNFFRALCFAGWFWTL